MAEERCEAIHGRPKVWRVYTVQEREQQVLAAAMRYGRDSHPINLTRLGQAAQRYHTAKGRESGLAFDGTWANAEKGRKHFEQEDARMRAAYKADCEARGIPAWGMLTEEDDR